MTLSRVDGATALSQVVFRSILTVITAAGVVLPLLLWGVIPASDTASYVSHSIIRPPAYPFLIDIFRFIFGNYFSLYLCAFQTALVFYAAWYFISVLEKDYSRPVLLAVFCVVTIYPVFGLKIGIHILTEAIAYAIFLTCIALMYTMEYPLKIRTVAILSALMGLNLLFKPQTAFLYPVYVILLFRIYVQDRRLTIFVKPAFLLVVSFLCAHLVDRAANLAYNGSFTGSSIMGLQLAKDALYISDPSDAIHFENTFYMPVVQRIYEEMDEEKLFSKYRHEHDLNTARYLAFSVNPAGAHDNYLDNPNVSDIVCWRILTRQAYFFQNTGRPRTSRGGNNGRSSAVRKVSLMIVLGTELRESLSIYSRKSLSFTRKGI